MKSPIANPVRLRFKRPDDYKLVITPRMSTFLLTTEKQWTLEEIAEHQGVDLATVRRWTKRRVQRLRVMKLGHRTVRVPDTFYANFLQSRIV